MEEIIDLCKKIDNHVRIRRQGYGDYKDEIWYSLVAELKNTITVYFEHKDLESVTVCNLFNYLYSISSFNIPEVNEILLKANYSKKLETETKKIMDKINRQDNMTAQEYSYAQFLLIHGFINECKVYWCNLLLKALVDGKFHIEYADLEDLIILYFKDLIKKEYSLQDVEIFICPFEEDNKDGKAYFNKIFINDRLIKILCENFSADNLFELMRVVFHEATHVHQSFRVKNGEISKFNSIVIKDFILCQILDDVNYYDKNYLLLSRENEAIMMGDQLALKYVKFLDLQISNELDSGITGEIVTSDRLLRNLFRVDKEKLVNINELFDRFDLNNFNIDYFKEYPQLNLEYIAETTPVTLTVDGYKCCFDTTSIRKRTLEEIEEEYQGYLNGTLKLNGKKEEIIQYFNYLKSTLGEEGKNFRCSK